MQASRSDIAAAVLELMSTGSQKKVSTALAAYLVQERRSGELDQIMREVTRLRAAKTGVTEVTLTSAFPLKDSVKKALTAQFGKTINNEVIDTSVLGGVRVETNADLLDLTVRSRLNRLKTL